MYNIDKHERAMLLKQANASRMLYRWMCALPYAAGLVAVIVAGMWFLK